MNKKLDRAVEETFPSSDPVSVSITKGGATDYDHDDDEAEDPSIVRSNPDQQGTSESLLNQAKEKLSDVGSTFSEAAHEAYAEGSRYVREAVGHHPEMERYYRQGTEAATVSSAWRRFVPEAGKQSPRRLRLAEANAPHPNPWP